MQQTTIQEYIKLSRCYLLKQIGAGGMGKVYLGKWLGSDILDIRFARTVAIKLITHEGAQDERSLKMFIREAELAIHLHHKNVTPVIYLGKEDELYYIVMEYVQGESLHMIAKKFSKEFNRPLPLDITINLFVQVCEGINYAHNLVFGGERCPLAHRDIKPQNIMLTYDGEIKVIDFGIAKLSHSNETTMGSLTPQYASPERLRGQSTPELDLKGDIYALGIVLWELITGKRLFEHDNLAGLIHAVVDEPVPTITDSFRHASAPKLDEICQKALAKKPEDRFSSIAEMLTVLRQLIHDYQLAISDNKLTNFMAEYFQQTKTEKEELFREISGWAPPADDSGAIGISGIVGTSRTLTSSTDYPKAAPPLTRASNRALPRPATAEPLPAKNLRPYWLALIAIALVFVGIWGAILLQHRNNPEAQPTEIVEISPPIISLPSEPEASPRLRPAEAPLAAKTPSRELELEPIRVPERINPSKLGNKPEKPIKTGKTAPPLQARSGEKTLAPTPNIPAKPSLTSLSIQSEPAGAEVLINNENKGKTPLTLDKLPLGTYQLALSKTGFETQQASIEAQNPSGHQLSYTLKALKPTEFGSLMISAKPAVSVYLDGQKVGETPLFQEKVASGKHQIRLQSADGRVNKPIEIMIEANKTSNQNYAFTGKLKFIGTVPLEATLDFKGSGRGTRIKISENPMTLPIGEYTVTYKNGASQYKTKDIVMKENEVTILNQDE